MPTMADSEPTPVGDSPDPSTTLGRPVIDQIADRITESINADPRIHRPQASPPPDQGTITSMLDTIQWLLFPGFTPPYGLAGEDLASEVRHRLGLVAELLSSQVFNALRDQSERSSGKGLPPAEQEQAAAVLTRRFIEEIPRLGHRLSLDVQAAYDNDPAARNPDEIIHCHPGLRALWIHRIAHCLHCLEVPLIPRMMSEHAHSITGIDIHPGARIGDSFFIDHGTGVVIGETSIIGSHCRIYQGVTLGAAIFERDDQGQLLRGTKRHPTLEDHVTVYSGATILGGTTIIGAGTQVNGGVFLTKSVPPGHVVRAPKFELTIRSNPEMPPSSFQI
ncbi:MAG: serine acetyltransferase [Phycisphaerae bacterium]|nr:serine acetyltransferase [Phycisphaerae bacterium]